MRLIDADALQELFNEVSTDLLRKPEITKDIAHMVKAFIMTTEMIKDAPTIDAAPVVNGHWIKRHDKMKCSKCKFFYYVANHYPFNYCPDCGARMDEEGGCGDE